tara:strand:+ start:308 stop:1120 length:813 start_codon:yes stop_codon:yes gene_type:complete
MTAKIAIIGHGFVGSALSIAFCKSSQYIIDPITHPHHDYDGLIEFNPMLVFICVPTPMSDDGAMNSSNLYSVMSELHRRNKHLVKVIKSTVVPDQIKIVYELYENVIYNPEFLRENDALHDLLNPEFRVLGGNYAACERVSELYDELSVCEPCPVHITDVVTASWVKYTINTFLATKVAFFNSIAEKFEGDWSTFQTILGDEPRLGSSHMQVPGPDGLLGFGGPCLPKDIKAIAYEYDLPILDAVIKYNNQVRSKYDTIKREKDQNIVYI